MQRFYLSLSVSPSVCSLDYSESSERILIKFFRGIERGPRTNQLDLGGSLDHSPDPGIF